MTINSESRFFIIMLHYCYSALRMHQKTARFFLLGFLPSVFTVSIMDFTITPLTNSVQLPCSLWASLGAPKAPTADHTFF